MTTHLLHDRLTSFLMTLECLGPAGQKDAFMNEAMENGGTYVPPDGHNRSSHLFEIALHGVNAWGASEDEAIRNWIKAATAQAPWIDGNNDDNIDAGDDTTVPFPNPRNHGEEIANTRASLGQDWRS